MTKSRSKWGALAVAGLAIAVLAGGATAGAITADAIYDATGVRGGLLVQLGCGDGTLTADLRASDRYLVQGLDTDPVRVAAARELLHSKGVYGPVTAEVFDGRRLPYVGDLVNLVIAEDPGEVTMDEVLRVLAPGGVAYIRQGDGWQKTVKPRPGDIDE